MTDRWTGDGHTENNFALSYLYHEGSNVQSSIEFRPVV